MRTSFHLLLKTAANGFALLCVLPAFVVYQLGRVLLGQEKAFPGWSQAFSLLPGLTGVYLRRAFYCLVLSDCSRDCCLSFGTVFSHASAEVGPRVYTGVYCCLGDITLEADVLLGSHVSIMNGGSQHGTERLDIPIREQPGLWQRVTIGRDTWIGDRAIILADVGKQCIIGAGSVVTKAIPDFAVAAGSPAKIIRFRDAGEGQEISPANLVAQ